MNSIIVSVVVFLVFFSPVIIHAPVSAADSVVIPEMQQSVEKKQSSPESNVGVTAKVYVLPTSARS